MRSVAMPQHFDTVLPLLSECVSARDAMPLQAALTSAFTDLVATSDAEQRERLTLQQKALEGARSSAELRVAAARSLRELMQARPAEPGPPPPPRPSRDERRRARAARSQARALEESATKTLRPAQQPIESLSGVGGAIGQALRTRGVAKLSDLIWLL